MSRKSVTQLHKQWARKASWNEIFEGNFEGVENFTLEDAKSDLLNLRRKIRVA